MINTMFFTILVLIYELLDQLMTFDSFAPFIKALNQTIKDSVNILFMFGCVVVIQTILMYVLDDNTTYNKNLGVVRALLDSYKIALGDFAVAEDYIPGSTHYYWLFQIFFLIFTVISLLIILNMVIAVMSSSFDKVQSESTAYVMMEKVKTINDKWFTIPI